MITGNKLFGRFSFTRHGRVEKYLENLDENISISPHDREIVDEIKDIINVRIKALRGLNAVQIFLYLGIYFSFVSFFFEELPLLEQVGTIIKTLISIFGTTVFLIAIFLVTKTKELYYEDLNLLTSHIIALYNNKFNEDDELKTFKTKNDYEVFLSFFRNRGFDK